MRPRVRIAAGTSSPYIASNPPDTMMRSAVGRDIPLRCQASDSDA